MVNPSKTKPSQQDNTVVKSVQSTLSHLKSPPARATFHSTISMRGYRATGKIQRNKMPYRAFRRHGRKRLDSTVAMATTRHEELLEVVVVTVQ